MYSYACILCIHHYIWYTYLPCITILCGYYVVDTVTASATMVYVCSVFPNFHGERGRTCHRSTWNKLDEGRKIMEHKFDEEDIDALLGIENDDATDFEQFLKEKVETCATDIISEMKSLPIQDVASLSMTEEELQTQAGILKRFPALRTGPHAVDVEGIAPSARNLSQEEKDALRSSGAAHDAGEKTVRFELRTKPIVGSAETEQYINEVVEPANILDDEAKKVFTDTIRIAVTECSPEQVIRRINDLARSVLLYNLQMRGLTIALEELLKATTIPERARLLELDRQFKSQARGKAKGTKPKVAKEAKEKVLKAGKKSPAMASIDTMFTIGYSKATAEEKMQKANLLDSTLQAYIDKVYA